MPTSNPRVNVTLSPSLDALVCRLAALERISKSMVLRQLLEAAEPSLEEAIALMEAAVGASFEARSRIAADMQKGLEIVRKAQDSALNLIATSQLDLVEQAEVVKGRRPSRPQGRRAVAGVGNDDANGSTAKVKRPPLSNRGVRK